MKAKTAELFKKGYKCLITLKNTCSTPVTVTVMRCFVFTRLSLGLWLYKIRNHWLLDKFSNMRSCSLICLLCPDVSQNTCEVQ